MTENPTRRTPLGAWLALLLVALGPLSAFWLGVWPALASRHERRLDEIAQGLRSWWQGQAEELRRRLQALATSPEADNLLLLLAEQRSAPPNLVDLAGQWMRQAGIEVLTVADGEGRVLSCGQLPGRAGEQEQLLAGQLPDEEYWFDEILVRRQGLATKVWALQAVYERRHDQLSLRLHGGRVIDEAALCQLQRITGARLALAAGGTEQPVIGCGSSDDWLQSAPVRLSLASNGERRPPLQLAVALAEPLGWWRIWLVTAVAALALVLAVPLLLVSGRKRRADD